MFAKDLFPDTPLLLYCECFIHGKDDLAMDSSQSINEVLRYRISNAAMLVDLEASDAGISPTYWQHPRFPSAYQPSIKVLHDGIDTSYFQPDPDVALQLPGVDLSQVKELVTYVARGMDAYRGFPQFIEALSHLLPRRPDCHVHRLPGCGLKYPTCARSH